MAATGKEDGGVRVPRIVVLCIVVSFLVSTLSTVLVSGLLPGEKEPAEAPSSSEPAAGGSSEIVPGSGGSRDSGAPLPREISDLREKVERRERQLAERGPAPSPDEAIREEEALARLTAKISGTGLEAAGEKAVFLPGSLARFIRRHRFEGTLPRVEAPAEFDRALEALVRRHRPDGRVVIEYHAVVEYGHPSRGCRALPSAQPGRFGR